MADKKNKSSHNISSHRKVKWAAKEASSFQYATQKQGVEAQARLVCKPPKTFERESDAINFHVPHKKLLERIEYKKIPPEPLAGFKEAQKSFLRQQADELEVASHMTELHQSTSNESFYKFRDKVTTILPHHKVEGVMNQLTWIVKMRKVIDESFIYMTYAVPKASEKYTPYALKVVPYSKVDPNNYFTMSAQGVLQHVGLETTFTPLDKWEYEYVLYIKLMRFKTFFNFRLWKGFYVWRKTIIYRKFRKALRNIQNNLFYMNDDLRKGLLDIQSMSFAMSSITFIDSSERKQCHFFYLIENQMHQLETVVEKLKQFREVAKDIVYNSCLGALLAGGFVVNEFEDESEKKGTMKKTSYIEQAAKKRFCQRLCHFIILCDYLMINMMHDMITLSTNKIKGMWYTHYKYLPSEEYITERDYNEPMEEVSRLNDVEADVPLLSVDVVVNPETIVIDPTLQIVLDILNQVMDLWQHYAKHIQTFANDSIFEPFTSPIINGKVEDRICGTGPSLDFYLDNDEMLVAERNYFVYINEHNYTIANIFVDKLSFIQQFYAEDVNVTKEIIKQETDVEKFRNMCTRYYQVINVIDKLVDTQYIGILYLNLQDLKKTVKPEYERLIECLHNVLPWLGKVKTDDLKSECDNVQAILEQEPNTALQWADYLIFIEEANDRVTRMEELFDYIKDLYDLMEEYSMPIESEEMNNYLEVGVLISDVRNLTDKKIEELNKFLKIFEDMLNKDITKLVTEIANIKEECAQTWLYDIDSEISEVTRFLRQLSKKLTECQKRANAFKKFQKQFRLEVTKFDMLDEVFNEINLRLLLWDSLTTWSKTIDVWYRADFETLNVDEMNVFILKNVKNVNILEKGLPPNLIVPKLKDDVELIKDKLPVVQYLRNPNLKPRHWLKIETILNYKFNPEEILTLNMLESLEVFKYADELLAISGQASSEAGLEVLLKKVEEAWKSLEFNIMLHKDSKDVYILGSLEEVQTVLDESNININTIANSRHVGPIKPRVDEWIKMLDLFTRTLDEWTKCQQSWLYLEVIFSAPDIQRQLPAESKLFIIVDKSWKNIMRRVAKIPLALEACLYPGFYEELLQDNALLEQIMKCLESYLEIKRVSFPRFYFLSNDELLEILAHTRDPHAVQPHLRKCFDAITKLDFGMKLKEEEEGVKKEETSEAEMVMTTDILAMISPEGERVGLTKGLKARGNVEDWLSKVEASMFLSLRRCMKASIADYIQNERVEWVQRHPNQIILTVSQIMWAKAVHKILDGFGNKLVEMDNFEKKCIKDLNDLATLIRKDLPPVTRKILIALITIDVHARDTIHNLVVNKTESSESFDWLKALRYYWIDQIEDCMAKMSSTHYLYGYEYLGASGVLVITPLTDKCYLCLMGALQLDLGGAPAGPAGTGKTETTKDLAKALAIQCVVFNCSEGLDYKMMGRFFSGLAQSGGWCCFDEFNRIDIEVLSVIAQQLITIRNAKAAKLSRFMFEGREIKLIQRCAAFITMNPGYAGRTELPDNLKALFRPISMMVPDYALIAEVILYSEGFESSKVLSQKMVQMYKLCSEQLSQQDHYDFGMRAVKSVLVMAGALKRANPDRNENVVLICALRDSNLPKFLAYDSVLFQGILSDLFPGVDLPELEFDRFQEVIGIVIEENILVPLKTVILKVIQLYETMIVRWGVMLVGPTGGGKSTILKTLDRALTRMYEEEQPGQQFRPVHTYVMNPKAVTAAELYGQVDLFTLEWKDGLMGIIMRTAVTCTKDDHQWILCDGPVDAVWIENLNTVLDDNKMLCLANSERIKLTPYVHMLFEVMDLAQASPATVSRCGMVYVDSGDLKWMPYAQSWTARLPETVLIPEYKEYILELFVFAVEGGFDYIRKNCECSIYQVDISKVSMVCAILESNLLIPGAMDTAVIGEKSKVKQFLCQLFIFAYLWGLGGNLTEQSKQSFESHVRDQFEEFPDARVPPGLELWSAYIDIGTHRFELWTKIMPSFKYDQQVPFFEILVPTVDTVRFIYLLELLLNVNYHVMLVGDTGVGKSVIAKQCLDNLFNKNTFIPIAINFSAQTSSMRTQEMLELKLDRKKKTLLGAPAGKKVALFVDDVNMPKLETYGAQPPIELLRQFLDYGGLYDREKLFWKQIQDVVIATACAPPGGGRNPLTPRFVRHFGMLLISPPNELSLKIIFKSILKGFLSDFSNDVRDLGEVLVNAAVEIYDKVSSDLLPTPAKSHYVFNLRDLSKCIQGILQADSGSLRDENSMLKLFYHECLRVFHDRLIDVEDKSYFYFLMKEVCQHNFGTPVIMLPDSHIIENPPILLFGDFMVFGAAKENRLYEEIQNLKKLKDVLQNYLDDYNLSAIKEMHLIFFMNAIEHCIRIARILRSERGNALLVGVGGMGKQSLTRLASHLNDYKCFQIELTGKYDHNSFFEDLRKINANAGAKNLNTVFLFTDTQIVQEDFLEDINSLLNSGDVPNLFESDELEMVIIKTREGAIEAGIDAGNRDAVFDFFVKRVRANLHLVICMSPVGDSFRRRCRMFPSLVNCCTIDWFEKWPEEALLSVAKNKLNQLGDEELTKNIARICVIMHKSVEDMTIRYYNEMRRHYYTTPSSYLELLKLYLQMIETRKKKVGKTRDKILNGLNKIYETNSVIDSMKETLIELGPVLKEKSKDVANLMIYLEKESKSADKVREIVKGDEAAAKDKADATQAIAADAQKDLDTALPALNAALSALESLNKNDIIELKAFIKPPRLVQVVMESICLLLGAKPDWASAKVILNDVNFLKRLQDYDKDHIPENALRKLKTYVENPDFVPEKVAKVSKACTSMCLWVRAMDQYAKVFKIVEPKRKKLVEAELELNQVMGLLREKQAKLAEVEDQIAKLEAQFQKTMQEKQDLEDSITLTAARLNRAGRLNVALADEQIRWQSLVKEYGVQLDHLLGDVLLSSACMAYFGAFTNDYRKLMVHMWKTECEESKINISDNFSLENILSEAYEIRLWNAFGLPRDQISTENAILVTQSNRWALMIDPQEQANRWIRQMEAANSLVIIKVTDPGFVRDLELAIRMGKPVLLEEIGESLDPTLGPILLKQTFMQGGQLLIRLGDQDIEYDPNFKLYITTKLANPHYMPEVCIQVTIVNFTVTRNGLEDQLLADAVRLERPDLEESRTELITHINEDKNQLQNIEDKILYLLYNSSGNILDDEELIETLNESKETSAIIAARLREAEITEGEISEAREKYRPVAARGSTLYFVVIHLAEIDPMYQFSLKYFNQIFNNVISTSEKNPLLSERLNILIKEITLAAYSNISRGLFERHKLVYSFMLAVAILQDAGEIPEQYWNYLLRGPVGAKSEFPAKPQYPLITDAIWSNINYLSITMPSFAKVEQDINRAIPIQIGTYKLLIQLVPENKSQCLEWNEKLNDFEKLMLIKTLKEEKLIFGITEFVKIKLGQSFIESPQVSLNILYRDTTNSTPLIFVLSAGSDPFHAFQKFAFEMGFQSRIQSISLGQGQGPVAEKIIEAGINVGDWVFLQNCHLATSWMLSMESIVLQIANDPEKIHPEFRLFMSSMPSKSFPVSVLQNSVKVTNEPPKGLRSNIKRAFAEMDPDFFENHPMGQDWRDMLFGLCMFHGIIQERKKFGPLGWNITYEFNDSDREFAFNSLKMFCSRPKIPWDALEYLTGEITYGGRVTDMWDLRCLKTILKIFFSPQILYPDYKYSESGTYYCPKYEVITDFQEFIENLPILEEPEIFGMHDNANLVNQSKETQTVILTILETQPNSAGESTGGVNSDQIVTDLANLVTDLIKPEISMEEVNAKLFKKDDKDRLPSLTVVLMQEVDRYNKLLKLIHSSMDQLKKAIKGLVVMSEELEEVFSAFMNNQVPKMWAKKTYNSLKSLASWINDLVLRLDFISSWVVKGKPISFWISGFYFPQGFLTGVLQIHARKYKLPIDQLKFDFTVNQIVLNQENIKDSHVETNTDHPSFYGNLTPPKDGAFIHGLFVDAGRWDNKVLKLVDARLGEVSPSMPVIWIEPKTRLPEKDSRYPAPLYKTSVRAGTLSTTGHSTNFVIAVLLPSLKDQSFWILRGTALLTQITD